MTTANTMTRHSATTAGRLVSTRSPDGAAGCVAVSSDRLSTFSDAGSVPWVMPAAGYERVPSRSIDPPLRRDTCSARLRQRLLVPECQHEVRIAGGDYTDTLAFVCGFAAGVRASPGNIF